MSSCTTTTCRLAGPGPCLNAQDLPGLCHLHELRCRRSTDIAHPRFPANVSARDNQVDRWNRSKLLCTSCDGCHVPLGPRGCLRPMDTCDTCFTLGIFVALVLTCSHLTESAGSTTYSSLNQPSESRKRAKLLLKRTSMRAPEIAGVVLQCLLVASCQLTGSPPT